MPRKNIVIIANPVSGRGYAARVIPELRRRLAGAGASVDVRLTEKRGDARLFAETASGCDAILCIGGDGTVNEIASGLDLSRCCPIALIPTGTGNVLAKEFGIPRDLNRAIPAVLDGQTTAIDVGEEIQDGRRFCMMASAGFDSAVVHEFSTGRKGTMHMWQYLYWGMKVVQSYIMPRIRVEIDGRLIEETAGYVLVSNVRSYGGPLRFIPQADPSDGLFDVFVIRRRKKRDILRFFYHGFLNYITGRHIRMWDAVHLTGREVRLTSDAKVPVQMDGDAAGFLPLRLRVLAEKLQIIRPNVSRAPWLKILENRHAV